MRTRIGILVAFGLCLLGCGGGTSSNTSTAGGYFVTDLGINDLNASSGFSSAARINDQGQIVGPSDALVCANGDSPGITCGAIPAFLYSNGKVVNLGSKLALAMDINNKGQVVGNGSGVAASGGGTLLASGSALHIGTLLDAYAINDAGQVAGDKPVTGTGLGNGLHAVIWQNGQMTDLGTIGNTTGAQDLSAAIDINNKGQVTGEYGTYQGKNFHTRGFFWQNGKMADLGTLSATGNTRPIAINDAGQIIGTSQVNNGAQLDGFLWQNGQMIDLSAQTGKPFQPMGINNAGQIVGTAAIGSASTGATFYHAFLWLNGKLTDLNSLLPSNSGWVLNVASDINNRGQICGSGTHNGQYRLFLLNPSASLPF
ncbi:MAG TPA: hypothetical protein VFA07_09855 [Chthonomonadaceae bacterium]|nr:hypothetical protein [Chthonomonadaceae bacterium]